MDGQPTEWPRVLLLALCTWLLARLLELAERIAVLCASELETPAVTHATAAPSVNAGMSFQRCEGAGDTVHSWREYPASAFRVRVGPNYPRFGRKANSGPALGMVVAMDTYRAPRKMKHIMSQGIIQLPKPTPGWSEPYPEFIVVVQMMPVTLRHSLLKSESTDGETFHLIAYIRMRPGLAPNWKGDTDPQGPEELLKHFLLRADQDEAIALCLKEIGMLANLEDVGASLPKPILKILRRFNGKPVLTRPEHRFYRGPSNSYLEISLDGHQYSYATRAAMHSVIHFLDKIELAYGMVIEARAEAQMPEQMLFSCCIAKIDMGRVAEYPPKERDESSEEGQARSANLIASSKAEIFAQAIGLRKGADGVHWLGCGAWLMPSCGRR